MQFCGIELRHPVINASGTYDAIAAINILKASAPGRPAAAALGRRRRRDPRDRHGGICRGADAREFLAAGASLVAVGTENFRDPRAGPRVAAELAEPVSRGATAVPVLNLK